MSSDCAGVTPVSPPSTCVRTGGQGREGESSSMTHLPPLTLQELRVPTNGVSPVRLQRYDHSPYRAREWTEQPDDFHHNNGIYALQEKINLLKNHPSEIFNFMVVSGSPRLGKNYINIMQSTPLHLSTKFWWLFIVTLTLPGSLIVLMEGELSQHQPTPNIHKLGPTNWFLVMDPINDIK